MKPFSALIKPSGKTADFSGNPLLIDIIFDAGLGVRSPCGGKGICGKCSVKAEGKLSEKTDKEKEFSDNENVRLACQGRAEGNVEITIDESSSLKSISGKNSEPDSFYAAAVDIGTTSVKISIVSLNSGKIYPLASFLNPQRRFGHDVVSRISASADGKNSEAMTYLIRAAVENAIYSALKEFKIETEKLKRVVVSANTVMTYLFHGMKISGLGIFPYETPVKEFSSARGGDLGFRIFPEAEVVTMPVVSAYIGGDLVSGVLHTEKQGLTDAIFFADLGTNGEIFLRRGNKIYAASCAMGPALEGMNISCGMTAEDGAINHISFEQGTFGFSSIGAENPSGISGTGLIDFISILIDKGLISRNGGFNKSADQFKGIDFDKDNSRIYISEKVYLNQKDIRNIQLAKGALLAASEILLNEAGIEADAVRYAGIAGSFGDNLDIQNFRNLRFIPDFKKSEYIFSGNTSLASAQLVCLDDAVYKRGVEISRNIEYIELSNHKKFNDVFIGSLDF